jgi:protein TonB
MSGRALADRRDRWRSALIVGAIHLGLGYALLTGLGVTMEPKIEDPLSLISLADDPPPPPAEPMMPEQAAKRTERPKDPEGAAAPPALQNTPTPIVAPEPEVKLPPPPPIRAAPVPGQGTAPAAGAAPFPGPGTGRGGVGAGLGSGRFGDGTGGGGGGGRGIPAEWLRGAITPRDYPPTLVERRVEGTVHLRFVVARNGRVRDCRVTRSSGAPLLDATTCRLITQRFRYRPARDGAGQPVEEVILGDHAWQLGPPRPDQWYDAEEARD